MKDKLKRGARFNYSLDYICGELYLLDKAIIPSIMSILDNKYLKYFSNREIDILFNENPICVKLVIIELLEKNMIGSIFNHLENIGFDFFPWNQNKFRNVKYLRPLIREILVYSFKSVYQRSGKCNDDLVKEISYQTIINFLNFLSGIDTITILKEEINNLTLINATPNLHKLIPLVDEQYLDQEQVDQIIEELNYDYHFDTITSKLSYDTLKWFLLNPKVNIFNSMSTGEASKYFRLRKEYPNEFNNSNLKLNPI